MEVSENKTITKAIFVIISLSIFFLSQTSLIANDDTIFIKKGQPIDTVICLNQPNFSYALYLPSKYNKDSEWPVIYIFDPGARGKLGVQTFISVAEKYGYIVACSNNSRNGDMNKSIEAANSMFEDVELRFRLDFRRIYVSGLSGGSRVAAFLALNSNKIAGVIGCAAGFPVIDGPSLSNLNSFTYIGIVGVKDMNYLEMFDLEEKLNKLGATTAILTFDGGHNWPPSDILDDAIGWIQIQAMKKGSLQKNDTLIQSVFKRWKECIDKYKSQNDWFESARYTKYLIYVFQNLPEINYYQKELDSLIKTKSYRKAVKRWAKTREEEATKVSLLLKKQSYIVSNESLPDSVFRWWELEIGKLKSLETCKDQNNQRMASRILMLIWSWGNENAYGYMKAKQYEKTILAYRLNSVIHPENSFVFYQLAKAYAFNNEIKNSIKALEKAIILGTNSRTKIENEEAFVSLKNEKRYKSLLAKLK